MREFDLFPSSFSVDHDPGNQIATDPSGLIGTPMNGLLDVFTALPKMIFDAIIKLFTDPGAILDLIGQWPGVPFELMTDFLAGVPFIGPIVEAITGIFGSLLDLSSWFDNLTGFLGGADFGSGAFNIPTAALGFFTSILDPLHLIFSQGALTDAQGFSAWPFNWGGDWLSTFTNPIIQFIRNFVGFIPGLDLFNFDTNTTGTNFAQNNLIPSGVVAPLIDGVLQDLHAPPIVQSIIDLGVNAAEGVVDNLIFNNPVSAFFEALLGHRVATGSAQASGDFANARNVIQDARLNAQEAAGTSLGELFDGASSTALPSPPWSQLYNAGHAISCGLDGVGNCVMIPGASTSAQDTCTNRYTTPVSSDTQSVFITLKDGVHNELLSSGSIALEGRKNTAQTECVFANIAWNSAAIGYMLGGTRTLWTSYLPVTHGTGDSWEFQIGVSGNARKYQLLQNGLLIVDHTEVGTTSAMGASNRYTGFAMQNGVTYFWIAFQTNPGTIQSWSASDRT